MKDQFEVLQVFSSVSIEKEFFIQEFLDSYPSVVSNLVKALEEHDLIESNYKIISGSIKLINNGASFGINNG